MIRGIIFDFDGVIADSEPIHFITFRDTVKELGIEIIDGRWAEFEGIGGRNIMKKLFEENGIKEDIEKWVKIRRMKFLEYVRNNEIPLKDGLIEFLGLIEKRKIKKIIASGSRHEIIDAILKKTKIEKYFPLILGSEDVKNKKPDPEIFLLAAERLKLKKNECLIIEDSESGVEAAERSEIPYICVHNPLTQELKGCPSIIKSYKEFPMELLSE